MEYSKLLYTSLIRKQENKRQKKVGRERESARVSKRRKKKQDTVNLKSNISPRQAENIKYFQK